MNTKAFWSRKVCTLQKGTDKDQCKIDWWRNYGNDVGPCYNLQKPIGSKKCKPNFYR